jgi:hypothetical protein
VSIRSISRLEPGLGFAQPQSGGFAQRRPHPGDPAGLSLLSWEDREIIAAMFGSEILGTGRDADGVQVGVPAFVWLVIEDRRSGRLPVGSEITSSYLQAVRDRQDGAAGPEPLPDQALAAALAFLTRRAQGAAVDLRA